jgi:Bacterial Ig-like domain (group 3)
LEQVHVRGIVCRIPRLEFVAGIGIALAMSALALAAQDSQSSETRGLSTQTSLTAQTRDRAGRTQATVLVNVTGEDGLPATGGVAISDHGMQVAGAALNAKGEASIVVALPGGDHFLAAAYAGDATHQPSVSPVAEVQAQVSGTPNFTVSVTPATLTLTAGQSGTVTASVTPQNSSALTAPMFITMSCSGLPDQSSCSFTPESLEILPNATAPLASSMVILTQAASYASLAHPKSNSVAWAILLPGALGLGGLAWGMRRRPWLNRLSLLALVALVTTLGTTACNPRYYYEHHGPPINPATPAGTYTININAQSSNGVTAITNTTTMSLTVQ